MLQDFFMPGFHNQDFASLASSGDTGIEVVTNAADFSNSILKWSKLTLRWIWEPSDITAFSQRELLVAVMKRDQDDTSFPQLDSEEVIRELRNDKKLMRGPWIIHPPNVSGSANEGLYLGMQMMLKPIVLKNFVMDREEDLVVAFTNINGAAFGGTSQVVKIWPQGFVRVIK